MRRLWKFSQLMTLTENLPERQHLHPSPLSHVAPGRKREHWGWEVRNAWWCDGGYAPAAQRSEQSDFTCVTCRSLRSFYSHAPSPHRAARSRARAVRRSHAWAERGEVHLYVGQTEIKTSAEISAAVRVDRDFMALIGVSSSPPFSYNNSRIRLKVPPVSEVRIQGFILQDHLSLRRTSSDWNQHCCPLVVMPVSSSVMQ